MRAIIQERYGDPGKVLRLDEVANPTVGDDQILVRVHASSVNAGDWRRVRASPFIVRLTEGFRKPKQRTPGGDVGGVVEAVGKNVTSLKPGDEVYGARTGSYAEYVSGRSFVPKPSNITLEEAAAIPIAGLTALQAVRDKGRIAPGQRVLVNGAGGGVGTFAVQLAKAFGADVTAVTNSQNVELMRSIGADRVIDYTAEDFTKRGDRYDLIVDVAGRPSLGACRRALAPGGTLACVGAGHGRGGPVGHLIAGLVRSRVLKQRVQIFIAKVNTEDLMTLKSLIEAGKVKPVIDRTYPLSEAAEALRYVEQGRARGKVVITI